MAPHEKRVAVIAIHGVGDHQPFEMARAVGDLLQNLEGEALQPRYCPFHEEVVRLNVAPVKVKDRLKKMTSHSKVDSTWGPLGALSASKSIVSLAKDAQVNGLDHLFMEGQLSEYRAEGPDETFQTLRLNGKRLASPAKQGQADTIAEKDVDVYDMFWSDLSGVAKAGLRIFGELYQLLFHLGSIGVNNVDAAAVHFKNSGAAGAWKGFGAAQARAASVLARPIVVFNLLLLALAIPLVAAAGLTHLDATEEVLTTGLLAFAAGTAFWGYGIIRRGKFASFRLPVIAFLTLSTLLAIFVYRNPQSLLQDVRWREASEIAGATMALVVSLAAAWFIVLAYDKRRPGARSTFLRSLKWVFPPMLAYAAGRVVLQPCPFLAMTVLLRLLELTAWWLVLLWGYFWLVMAAAFLAGYRAVQATVREDRKPADPPAPQEADRARRTNWTARLTLTLPATMFLMLTFAGWMGIICVSLPVFPQDPQTATQHCAAGSRRPLNGPAVLCYRSTLPPGAQPQSVNGWAWNILIDTGSSFMPLFLLLVCAAAVISIWGMAPSIQGEVSPPGKNARRSGDAALGNWLTNGYGFMRWAGRLIYLGMVLFPLAALGAWSRVWQPDGELAVFLASTAPFQQALGVVVAGAGVGILGFGGRLSNLALGFRPLVRVALDVDNWMREHPRNANPTARICARYVSLLRYIAQWTKDGKGYDELIIFAHSQGTVITADLMRFLTAERKATGGNTFADYDPALAGLDKMEIRLFTMGCPLQQLYGLRFPYLYGYAPSKSDTESNTEQLPRPGDLGMDLWINAYRTGDYVGRHLWRPHPWERVEDISYRTWNPSGNVPKHIWAQDNRVEFAIGPGAHTHYWDSTAKSIGETMDVLLS